MENRESITPIKIAIGVPNESYIPYESYDNHMLLMKHLGAYEARNPKYEFYWYTTGRLLTPMAREKLINVAINENCDYIFMLDNDMIYPIDFFEAMLSDLEAHPEIDILAPLAFMRNPPHLAVMYTLEEGYDSVRNIDYYINQPVRKYPRNELVECDAVGFGAVAIKVSMLKELRPPYCFSTTGSGEDIYLCHKAKQEARARIFMDTRIKLGHIGKSPIIDEDFHDKYNKDNKLDYEEVEHKYLRGNK